MPSRQQTVAAAYNQSIYMMLTVPYTLLGVFGFLIYRGIKKNEAYRNALHPQPANSDAELPFALRKDDLAQREERPSAPPRNDIPLA